ncbi:MarR family transcriptional regulator [Flavobacteriaceae bacterium]|jgi:DNA-binding MarR family transcriptional regulator|nr:MarR family transcriptional regulator [Flavobacteriaceae bacterium]MDA8643698.1 MarR family transcriptional regulator [Flavobacteriaceae bacterium]MDA9587525.1 MarR family transcriptional regulator [Flavobacteriaceae bacterium]MDC0385949.1 MarR family transcriptional regulator [Flavobacteriaceae bacterium]
MSIDTKQIIISILETNCKVLEILGQALKPYEISLQQFNVLRILRGQKGVPANLSTVQERMVNRMSNTTRIIDKLIDKNFVQRNICEKNRRKIELFITDEGMSLLKVVDPVVDKAEKQITQALRSDEQENLFELLRKINL